MANNLTARPWFIDSVSATPVWNAPVFIKFIEVVGGNAVALGGSLATITDRNGRTIISPLSQANALGELQTYNLENWFNGLIVSALSTGTTLLVHVK